MNRFSIIISSLFLIFHSAAWSQNISQTFEYAGQQLNRGNTGQAISLFRRVLFFDSTGTFSYEACKKLVTCYIYIRDYARAEEFSGFAANLAPNDSQSVEQIFQTAFIKLLKNEPEYAMIELYGISDSLSYYFQVKKNFYLGVTCFQLENYRNAIDYFVRCNGADEKCRAILIDILKEINHIERRYNPKTARLLSIILPGSGQLYCGDIKGAINSLALTTGLVLLYINTAANYSFIDAAISVLPWFQRYYQGGYQNAAKAALKRRQKRINIQYQKILTVLDQQ